MNLRRTALLTVFFLFLNVLLYGQNDTAETEDVVKKAGSGIKTFYPAIELEADILGFIPNYSIYADFGFRTGKDLIIGPRIGFSYFMDIWTDVHGEFYIPAGLRVSLPLYTFTEVLYYFPLDYDFENIRLRVNAGGELFAFYGSSIALSLTAGIGAGFFYFPDSGPMFPFTFKTGFRIYF